MVYRRRHAHATADRASGAGTSFQFYVRLSVCAGVGEAEGRDNATPHGAALAAPASSAVGDVSVLQPDSAAAEGEGRAHADEA